MKFLQTLQKFAYYSVFVNGGILLIPKYFQTLQGFAEG
jgi:hypothetical protein